jgi:hypothetical protein
MKDKERAWNRRIWFAIPELRSEPFPTQWEARQAFLFSPKMESKTKTTIYAFPSREDARKLNNISMMPSEVVYKRLAW